MKKTVCIVLVLIFAACIVAGYQKDSPPPESGITSMRLVGLGWSISVELNGLSYDGDFSRDLGPALWKFFGHFFPEILDSDPTMEIDRPL